MAGALEEHRRRLGAELRAKSHENLRRAELRREMEALDKKQQHDLIIHSKFLPREEAEARSIDVDDFAWRSRHHDDGFQHWSAPY